MKKMTIVAVTALCASLFVSHAAFAGCGAAGCGAQKKAEDCKTACAVSAADCAKACADKKDCKKDAGKCAKSACADKKDCKKDAAKCDKPKKSCCSAKAGSCCSE